MAEGDIYLGIDSDEDLISTHAKEVLREFEEIGRSGRTASGRLVKDIVSRKYKFSILYGYINQAVFNIIIEKYGLDEGLNLRMYISESEWFTNFDGNCPVVRILPFGTTDFMPGRSTKLYRGSSIVFEEV